LCRTCGKDRRSTKCTDICIFHWDNYINERFKMSSDSDNPKENETMEKCSYRDECHKLHFPRFNGISVLIRFFGWKTSLRATIIDEYLPRPNNNIRIKFDKHVIIETDENETSIYDCLCRHFDVEEISNEDMIVHLYVQIIPIIYHGKETIVIPKRISTIGNKLECISEDERIYGVSPLAIRWIKSEPEK